MITLGVVLAAGEGRRFGGPKAPYIYKGERLVDRVVTSLHSGGCDRVLVILGAWIGEVPGAEEVLINSDWNAGISTSLAVALDNASNSDADRLCIMLVDLPGVTSSAIARVLESKSEIAMATYEGGPSHPVVLKRDHWKPLGLTLSGDSGAREYLRDHQALVEEIAIDDIADGLDLDYEPTAGET
jgi:CTP:molybdopterin cytidylyltransferase MocA